MLENIDTLSTSYSDRKNFMKNSSDSNRTESTNHDFKGGLKRGSEQPNRRSGKGTQGTCSISPTYKMPPNAFIIADNKEVTLSIDLKKGEIWTRPDHSENHTPASTLEPEVPQRIPSPVGVQKVTVKSVNVAPMHPKKRDSHGSASQMQPRPAAGDSRHSKSQDVPQKVRSLPRSSVSLDNVSVMAGSVGVRHHSQSSSISGDDDRYRKLSTDNMAEDSGVENTSNMNVRRAKAMFEEISRSTENLLEIGKMQPALNRNRQSPRQETDRKEFTYNETNNNHTKKGSGPIQDSGPHLLTDLDSGETVEAKIPLSVRFPSVIPQHGHTRSLPIEYEEANDTVTGKALAAGRSNDGSRRPRSAHYLLDNQSRGDPLAARRLPAEQYNNQAQLMRSFRVSKSMGRAPGMDFASGYEGDAESDSSSAFRRQSATRRSVEDLRYLPSVAPPINSAFAGDGIPRSATLPATEMREAAKKYQQQLFQQHPSSYRYSFGHTVEQPRLKRSSSFGSKSQTESPSSTDQPVPKTDVREETVKASDASDDVFQAGPKLSSTVSDSHLSQAYAREDAGNSILSRLLREHNANTSGGNLAKIEEEAQRRHGPRLSSGSRSTAVDEEAGTAQLQSHLGQTREKQLGNTRRVELGSGVKTVAVSSSTTPVTSSVSSQGQRGYEYVQGMRKPSLDRLEGETRPYDRTVEKATPRLDDFVGSAVRSQGSAHQRGVVPVTIQSKRSDPMILQLDSSPKSERKGRPIYTTSRLADPVMNNGNDDSTIPDHADKDEHLIAHDKEPSTDSVKELREIEESARYTPQGHEDTFESQAPDLEKLPPPPDELLAESPPEREKPQRTINRKKRDNQQLQSSSRNSSCVSTDSTTSTATADSGIGMRACQSADSSPRTSPLAEDHSGYDYCGGKEGQTFKGSQEISDEDEGITAELPHATSTPDRTSTSYSDMKVDSAERSDRGLSQIIMDTPGSSPPTSRPGSASPISPRFEELDSEKSKLIQSMRDKIRELKHEELEISDEIKANEVLGNRVRSMIEARANQTEFSKYELFIGELNNIVALLLSLTQRLHRYELMLQDLDMSEEEDKQKRDELIRKIDKLKNQHEEACRLREVNDKRGEYVSTFLEKYCSEEEHADFQYYVDMKSQLALMQSEIKEKVKLAEERLKALECTALEWST